jgi:hypothetical protein
MDVTYSDHQSRRNVITIFDSLPLRARRLIGVLSPEVELFAAESMVNINALTSRHGYAYWLGVFGNFTEQNANVLMIACAIHPDITDEMWLGIVDGFAVAYGKPLHN